MIFALTLEFQGKEISELRERVEECKSDNRVITQRHDQEVEKNSWNVEKIHDLQVNQHTDIILPLSQSYKWSYQSISTK